MIVTAVPLAAAIAVEVTAATVVMTKINRDNSSRGAAAVLDNRSIIGAKYKSNRGIGDNGRCAAAVVFSSGPAKRRQVE
jgi:hypothetical protein